MATTKATRRDEPRHLHRYWLDIRAVESQPIWLSVDGEVATAESGFAQAKHPRGLIVYRRATGRPRTTQEEGGHRRGAKPYTSL